VSNTTARPAAFVLVESGLHAGARLELREHDVWYSVGGVVDAEYWMADDDLAEAKAEFGCIAGQLRIRVLAGPEAVVGPNTVPLGQEILLEGGVLWGGIGFRGVVLPEAPQVEVPQQADSWHSGMPQQMQPLLRRKRFVRLLVATVAVIVPLLLVFAQADNVLTRMRATEQRKEVLAAQKTPAAKLAYARAAAQRMADLIAMQSISVSAPDANTLLVSGTEIGAEHREAIEAAITQFQSDFQVRNAVSYRSEPARKQVTELAQLPTGIDLVEYGSNGYLRGKDGQTYMTGGVLPDGAQVMAINEAGIWLAKGTERAVLRAGATQQ
jgi:hypothetical protein